MNHKPKKKTLLRITFSAHNNNVLTDVCPCQSIINQQGIQVQIHYEKRNKAKHENKKPQLT